MTLEVFICVCVAILAYFMQFAFDENQTRFGKIVDIIANILLVVTLGYLFGVGIWKLWLWELCP